MINDDVSSLTKSFLFFLILFINNIHINRQVYIYNIDFSFVFFSCTLTKWVKKKRSMTWILTRPETCHQGWINKN